VIGLLSCSATKLDRAAPASQLYTSPLFRMSLAYLKVRCAVIYVLSARHGLLETERVIEPYDQRLGGKKERERWARTIAIQLGSRHKRETEIILLAGADYARPLVTALHTLDGMKRGADGGYRYSGWRAPIMQPLAGMTVGRRLQWLSANAPSDSANIQTGRASGLTGESIALARCSEILNARRADTSPLARWASDFFGVAL
jgi:hypothetical protein